MKMDDNKIEKWGSLTTRAGPFIRNLKNSEKADQYGILRYYKDSEKIGLFASVDLCKSLGMDIEKVESSSFTASDFVMTPKKAKTVLQEGGVIDVLVSKSKSLMIFPMGAIPKFLEEHIQLIEARRNPEQVVGTPITASSLEDIIVKEEKNMDLSSIADSFADKSFNWADIRTRSSHVLRSLEQGNDYDVIEYSGKVIGLVVTPEIRDVMGLVGEKSCNYGVGEIDINALNAIEDLNNGNSVTIEVKNFPKFIIYPISKVPLAIANYILNENQLSCDVNNNSMENSSVEKISVKEGRAVNLFDQILSFENTNFIWSDITVRSSRVAKSLNDGFGYAAISFYKNIVGLAVTPEIRDLVGEEDTASVAYSVGNIDDSNAIHHLNNKRAVTIKRRESPLFTIYPISDIPTEIATYIIDEQKLLNNVKVVDVVKLDCEEVKEKTAFADSKQRQELSSEFDVVSLGNLNIPSNLSEKIEYKKREASILGRIADIQEQLKEKDNIVTVRMDGTDLEVTSNPEILSNSSALADYFGLQVQKIDIPVTKQSDAASKLIEAFTNATSYEGLTIVSPVGNLNMLITKDQDFFKKIKLEFC